MYTLRRFVAFFVLACLFATPAFAQSYTYSVYIDSDVNSATGCSVTLPNGTFAGVESVLTATVATGSPPQVTSVTRSTCSGSTFGAPVAEGSGAVSVGAGTGGTTAIELTDAVSQLVPPGTQTARIYVVARSATGDDVLLTTVGAAPIVVLLAQNVDVLATPLFGIPALILFIGCLLAFGSRAVRRRILKPLLLGLALFSGIAGAMIFPWSGLPPIATDPAGDTTSGEDAIDLRYFFVAVNGGSVFFRCDVTGSLTSPPVAVADTYTAVWNTTLTTPAPGVLGNDTVNGATISNHTNPSHGSVTLNANGGFAYTPTASYAGADSFTYTLTNFGGSSTATVSFNVVAAPLAAADNFTTSVGTTLNVSAPGVLGNDQLGSPAGTLVSFGGGSLGGAVTANAPGAGVALAGGTLTLNANGSLTLSAPTTPGNYTFQYRLDNAQGNSDGTVTIQVNKAPAITSLSAANFVLNAAGTFSIVTTGTPTVSSITLTGCTLPTGLTFSYTSGANATIAGTPSAGGVVSCTVTASNGVAPAATQTLTVAVSQAPLAAADSYTTTVGAAINTPAAGLLGNDQLGAPAATLNSFGGGDLGGTVATNAPGAGVALAGGTLTVNANGSFSLTAPTTPGTYAFQYEIGNSQGSSDGTVTIQVNAAPTITSVGPASFVLGTGGTYTITTTGTPTVNSITLTGCALQTGLVFAYTSGASASISGTPTVGGSVSCTVTADNGVAPAATQTLAVTVNQAPATVDDAYTTTVGTPLTVAVPGLLQNDNLGFPVATLTSFGGGNLGGAVTTNAAGATVALAGGNLTVNANGSLSLIAPTTAGTYTFQYEITNSQGTFDGNVTIQVNQGPTILTPNNVTFLVGSAQSFSITTSATPTVTSITLTGCTLPTGLAFSYVSGASATIAGTPTAGGVVNCTVTAGNGILPDAVQTLMVTVNQGPAAVADTYSTTLGTDITNSAPGVLGNDALGTPPATLTFFGGNSLGGGVTSNAAGASVAIAGGNLTLGADGALSLTSATQSGEYTFLYRIDNTINTADAMVTIDVNEAPAFTSANNTPFVATQPNTFTVTTTGFPKPALSVFAGTLPSGVTLTDNLDGTATLTGSPAVVDAGPHVVTIQATNGIGSPAQQVFTLQVNVAPQITSALSTTFTVGTAGSFAVIATGTPAPTIGETGALPAGVTLAGGVLSGTPAAGTGGIYPITITAGNGVGSNATQSFTLTVNQVPKITSPNSTTFPIGQPTTVTVQTTGFPRNPGMTITENPNPDSLPTGVTFTDNHDGTATLTGVPGPGTARAYGLLITADNGVPPPDTQAFNLTVTCPAIALLPATGAILGADYNDSAFTQAFTPSGGTAAYTYSVVGALPNVGFAGGNLQGTPNNTGTFTFTVQAVDANGCTSPVQNYTLVVKPVAAADTYPEGVIGNVSVNSANMQPSAFSATANDSFPAGGTNQISTYDAVSSQGGNVVMQTASGATFGQFTYDPPAGYTGSDSFTYTLSSNGQTAVGTVNLTVSGMIWFINNAGGAGDGRLSSPFNTTAAFQAVNDGTGRHPNNSQTIFVYESGADYGGTLTLRPGQKLVGQDATVPLATIAAVVPGSSSTSLPVMNPANSTFTRLTSTGNTVTLATNNILRGLNVATTGAGSALLGTTFDGLSLSEVNAAASGTGCLAAVNLQGASAQNIAANFNTASATGCANGIVVVNTTGSFAVAGPATSTITCGTGADNAIPGNGVYLNSVSNVSLNAMNIQTCPNFAIRGLTVAGFNLTASTIAGTNGNNASTALTPDNFGEGSVAFYGLTGSALIKNTSISGGFTDNFRVANTSGTLDRITFDTVTIGANDAGNGNAGVLLEPMGSSTMNVTVTNSNLTASRADLFHLNLVANATSDLIFTNNTLSNSMGASIATGGGGVTIGGGDSGTTTAVNLTYNIANNTFRDAVGHAILMVKSTAPGTFSGTFDSNTIGVQAVAGSGSQAGDGIKLQNAGKGTVKANITGNKIYQFYDFGIELVTGGSATAQAGALSTNITGNTIATINPQAIVDGIPTNGVQLNAGTVPGDTYQVCANVGGTGALQNTVTGSGNSPSAEIRLRQRQSTSVMLPGYGGATTDTAAVITYLEGRNTTSGGANGASATVNSPPGGGFITAASCP